ncbi:MAG: mobile mystery protein B [Calditrichia bacterium]
MSLSIFRQDENATPLSEEEKDDLIPSYISSRAELNESEQANILDAELWAYNRKRDVLDQRFLENLHKKMFDNVWKWAGKFRASERNIGVAPHLIRPELQQLLEDCNFWIANNTYSIDEITARFHHRLVLIHPFPNGNGRHARLAADLLLTHHGEERFSWGQKCLVTATETRQNYIAALRAADNHDLSLLLNFVRS